MPPEGRLPSDEGEWHELGEASGPTLDVSQHLEVVGPRHRSVDVSEHDGGRGAEAEVVFYLDADLPGPELSAEEVAAAVESVGAAMEFVSGHTLNEWLKREERGRPQILAMMQEAGRGLAAESRAAHVSGRGSGAVARAR